MLLTCAGLQVMTEGDAFHLAFHDAIDAVGWALHVQLVRSGALSATPCSTSDANLVLMGCCRLCSLRHGPLPCSGLRLQRCAKLGTFCPRLGRDGLAAKL